MFVFDWDQSRSLPGFGKDEQPAFANLLRIFNGHWYDSLNDRIPHYCIGQCCCTDRHHTVQQLTDALLLTVFAGCCPVPMPSRWTRITSSLIWFVLGWNVHNVLWKLFRTVFIDWFSAMFIVIVTAIVFGGIAVGHRCVFELFGWATISA